jgi:hypothetical protein
VESLIEYPEGGDGEFLEKQEGVDAAVRAIGATFLEEERRAKSADCFAQEYMCEFLTHEDAVFDHRIMAATMDDSIAELEIRRR